MKQKKPSFFSNNGNQLFYPKICKTWKPGSSLFEYTSTNTSQHDSTRLNTNQQESNTSQHESSASQHESDTSQQESNTSQHESNTNQYESDTSQNESTRV